MIEDSFGAQTNDKDSILSLAVGESSFRGPISSLPRGGAKVHFLCFALLALARLILLTTSIAKNEIRLATTPINKAHSSWKIVFIPVTFRLNGNLENARRSCSRV